MRRATRACTLTLAADPVAWLAGSLGLLLVVLVLIVPLLGAT